MIKENQLLKKKLYQLYLVEGLPPSTIAYKLNIASSLVKDNLKDMGICEENRKALEKEFRVQKKVLNKPYVQLEGNYVFYNGAVYEKMTKEKLKKQLMKDLGGKK